MLKNVSVLSAEQKLRSMATGVNITSGSGQPEANRSIRIHGMGLLNASSEPLFAIDGVPVTFGSVGAGTGADAVYTNDVKTNVMSILNPADVEDIIVIGNITVAFPYNSHAANRVISITIKKEAVGQIKVTLSASGGSSNAIVNFCPTLNGE